jgi:hypothetical protein
MSHDDPWNRNRCSVHSGLRVRSGFSDGRTQMMDIPDVPALWLLFVFLFGYMLAACKPKQVKPWEK